MEKFKAVTVSSLLLDSVDAVVLQSIPSSQPLETQIRKCVLGECECEVGVQVWVEQFI